MDVKIKEGIVAALSILFLTTLIITNLGHLLSPIGGIWNSSNQAYYPEYMEVRDPSLEGTVTVYRDNMGIPHIFATSENDYAFAVGYIQAQDRLFQIEMQRRLINGRIAELVGPDFLGYDIEARTLGFQRLGDEMYAALLESTDPVASDALFVLQRFCDGINRYIDDISPNKLPMEYLYLGIKPEYMTIPLSPCLQ